MSQTIHIHKQNIVKGEASFLPASKSISNRVLIINALASAPSGLNNLSEANDTELMRKLVTSQNAEIDVEDAGTTMRFLTALFAVTNQRKVLTGSHRMKERPIGLLVDALRTLGADIQYLEREGYPPIQINGFDKQKTDVIRIRGDVSSQYISALMMLAPVLPTGLRLILEGRIGSRPYIEMTAALMKHFGVESTFAENQIRISRQPYRPAEFTVESDWSGASYWFGFAALADEAEILLPRLFAKSLQGDHVIADLMRSLGVNYEILNDGRFRLWKGDAKQEIHYDFTHCPDLAQTVAVVCAAKNIPGTFTGLESLRIKETDRIAALQHELRKIGADLIEKGSSWEIIPSQQIPGMAKFETYKDHRMAMAFAPLATVMNIEIDNPSVVRKSYPRFWEDVQRMGFEVKTS